MDYQVTLDLIDKWTGPAKKITQSWSGMASRIGKTGKELKVLKSQLADVSKYTTLKKKNDELRNSYSEQSAAVVKFRKEIEATENPTKRQTQAFAAAERKLAKLGERYGKTKAEVNAYSKRLKRAKIYTNDLDNEQKRLGKSFNQLTAKIKLQRKSLKSWNSTVASAKKAGGKIATGAKWGIGATATAGFLGVNVFKGLSNTAGELERYHSILETLEKSSEKADESFAWIKDFTAKTPYEIRGVTESFVKLKSFGLDPMKEGLLKTLGDTSAAMGKPILQAIEMISDAVTTENDRLKEFGIRGSLVKGTNLVEYRYIDSGGKEMVKRVDKNNRAVIQSTLQAILNDKYAGAMDKMSGTWEGMLSNLSDNWTNFQSMIMDAGAFEWAKGHLSDLLFEIDFMSRDGSLQEWATTISNNIIKFGDNVFSAGEKLWNMGKKFHKMLGTVAEFVGGWDNLIAGIGAFLAIGAVASIFSMIGGAISLLIAPIGLASAAVTGLGRSFRSTQSAAGDFQGEIDSDSDNRRTQAPENSNAPRRQRGRRRRTHSASNDNASRQQGRATQAWNRTIARTRGVSQQLINTQRRLFRRFNQTSTAIQRQADVTRSWGRIIARSRSARQLVTNQRLVSDSFNHTNRRVQRQGGLLRQWGNLISRNRGRGKSLATELGLGVLQGLTDTTREFDRYRVTLGALEQDNKKAEHSFAWIRDFAVNAPFDIAQVSEEFIKLREVGLDPVKDGLLQSLGDAATAKGKEISEAVDAMTAAMEGDFAALNDFGVSGSEVKNTHLIEYKYIDSNGKETLKRVDKTNKALMQSTLQAIYNDKYAGSMDKMSGTWNGMLDNLGDWYKEFQFLILESGAFDWLSSQLDGLLGDIKAMSKDGSLKVWAEKTSDQVVKFGKDLWQTGEKIIKVGKSVFKAVDAVADFVGGWDNLIIGLGAFAVFGSVTTTVTALSGALAFVGAGAVLISAPVWLAVGAVTALGAAWYWWDDIVESFATDSPRIHDFLAFELPSAIDALGGSVERASDFGSRLWGSLSGEGNQLRKEDFYIPDIELPSFKSGESLGIQFREWIDAENLYKQGEQLGQRLKEKWDNFELPSLKFAEPLANQVKSFLDSENLYKQGEQLGQRLKEKWDNFELPSLKFAEPLANQVKSFLDSENLYKQGEQLGQRLKEKWDNFELPSLDWKALLPDFSFDWKSFIPAFELPSLDWQSVLPDFMQSKTNDQDTDFAGTAIQQMGNWASEALGSFTAANDQAFDTNKVVQFGNAATQLQQQWAVPLTNFNQSFPMMGNAVNTAMDTNPVQAFAGSGSDLQSSWTPVFSFFSKHLAQLKDEMNAILNTPLPTGIDNIPNRHAAAAAKGVTNKSELHVRIDSDKPVRVKSLTSARPDHTIQVNTGRMMTN